MLMVAIFESLKDSQEPSPDVGGSSLPKPKPESAPKNEPDGKILSLEIPTENPPSSEAEASRTCSPSDTSKANITTVKNPMSNAETSRPTTSHSDAPSDNRRPSDVDMADRTKVTVEVEKNPTTNIIDGLLRRWDIFRNR